MRAVSWALRRAFQLPLPLEPGFRSERLITRGVTQLHPGPDLEPEPKPLDLVGCRHGQVADGEPLINHEAAMCLARAGEGSAVGTEGENINAVGGGAGENKRPPGR